MSSSECCGGQGNTASYLHTSSAPSVYDYLGGTLPQTLPPATEGVAPPRMRGGLSGWQRRKVADYIEAHLSEVVRVPVLASLVELSPFHFSRVFKQTFGVPPHRYQAQLRMERAKAMLAERSVSEVAVAVGYAETSSFSAAFRRIVGRAPSAFKK